MGAEICQSLPRVTFSSGRAMFEFVRPLFDASESLPPAFVGCWAGISLHMAFPFGGKAHFYLLELINSSNRTHP